MRFMQSRRPAADDRVCGLISFLDYSEPDFQSDAPQCRPDALRSNKASRLRQRNRPVRHARAQETGQMPACDHLPQLGTVAQQRASRLAGLFRVET